jgi:hypothetical protein
VILPYEENVFTCQAAPADQAQIVPTAAPSVFRSVAYFLMFPPAQLAGEG